MYNTSNNDTSIGLPVALESAGAYSLLFITGLIFLFAEKNPRVRAHAQNSIMVSLLLFFPLFIFHLIFISATGILGFLPFIGHILGMPFGFLNGVDDFIALVAWVGFMIHGLVSAAPYKLPWSKKATTFLR